MTRAFVVTTMIPTATSIIQSGAPTYCILRSPCVREDIFNSKLRLSKSPNTQLRCQRNQVNIRHQECFTLPGATSISDYLLLPLPPPHCHNSLRPLPPPTRQFQRTPLPPILHLPRTLPCKRGISLELPPSKADPKHTHMEFGKPREDHKQWWHGNWTLKWEWRTQALKGVNSELLDVGSQ